jgi:ribosomal protein S18 acetylase RimI-like enzyme
MVSAEDAVLIYKLLAANGIPTWLTGGWGIDALLGEQTRPHKDLDIILLLDDTIRMVNLLDREGYRLKEVWSENCQAVDAQGNETATAFVLHDAGGREIDVHAMRLDDLGNGIPAWEAEGFYFKQEDLAGEGEIAGLAVRCLTPQAQVECHTGYALPEAQRGDLQRLEAKFSARRPGNSPWTSRPYHAVDDLRQMQDMLMEARSLTSDWRYWHVGELLWNYFMVDCHLKPQEYIRLWHNEQGKLVGYAMLGEDPSFDWQVLPEYEWRGIEEEALAWAESYLGALREQDLQLWGGRLVSGARQDNPQRIAFLEAHGFRQGGEFSEVNMLRSLDVPIPEAVLPAGCQVRSFAGLSEITNRAGAEREVWFPWTVGNVTDEDYARLMQLPGYERELDIIAIAPNGVIAAYVNCWIDPLNRISDLGPVGARPAYRRQGLTRAVLLEGLRRMKARGMQRACVSTGVNNVPAMRLYESIGFKPENRYLEYVRS